MLCEIVGTSLIDDIHLLTLLSIAHTLAVERNLTQYLSTTELLQATQEAAMNQDSEQN